MTKSNIFIKSGIWKKTFSPSKGELSLDDTIKLVTKLNSGYFNPLFTDASGTLSGVTALGNYIMLSEKICFFRVYVDFSNCTNFGTLQYQFNLPFPSIQTMRQAGGSLHQTTGNSLYHIAGITDVQISTTLQKLFYSGSTTDLVWKFNTPVGATTITSHFDISGTYEIQ
jgi:hypothetical protein